MLTFEDFLTRLALSQLKNTNAVDDVHRGIVKDEERETLLSLTNQGLIDLSARFPLFKAEVDLTLDLSQRIYPIVQAGLGTYLTATVEEPFLDDKFLRILGIYDANGDWHDVNTNGHIVTPSHNTLRFSTAKIEDLLEIGTKVRIRYQSKPETLTEEGMITLPPNLWTSLQLFVASLYFSHMGGADHNAKGDKYYGLYLRHVSEDEAKDLSSTSEVEASPKFEERGFV
jgi:hypothetical protein